MTGFGQTEWYAARSITGRLRAFAIWGKRSQANRRPGGMKGVTCGRRQVTAAGTVRRPLGRIAAWSACHVAVRSRSWTFATDLKLRRRALSCIIGSRHRGILRACDPRLKRTPLHSNRRSSRWYDLSRRSIHLLAATLKRVRGLKARSFGAIGIASYFSDTVWRAWLRRHLNHEFESRFAITGYSRPAPWHVFGRHSEAAEILLDPARTRFAWWTPSDRQAARTTRTQPWHELHRSSDLYGRPR